MELKQIFDLARMAAHPDLLDDIAELEARFIRNENLDQDDWGEDEDFEDDDVPGAPAPMIIQLAPAAFEALKAALQKAIPKLVA